MPVSSKTKRSKEIKKDVPVLAIRENLPEYRTKLHIGHDRTCDCGQTNINCLSAKEWLKSQLGVWRFGYEKRDVHDKELHPATFPISLSKKLLEF